MNELEHLKNLRSEEPGPTAQWIARTRNRLTDEARGDRTGMRPRVPRPRLGRVAAVGALSVALAVGLIMSQTVNFGGGAAPAAARADTILQKAAAAAERAQAGTGDFAYLRTKQTMRTSSGRATSTQVQWLSVDDSQPGLIRERTTGRGIGESGCARPWKKDAVCETRVEEGERVAIGNSGKWHSSTIEAGKQQSESLLPGPTYTYLRSVPEDPGKLASMLKKELSAIDSSIGPMHGISLIMSGQVVPPKTAAALFKAAQRFEGVEVQDSVTLTASGKQGIAVTHTFNGVRTALVFDRQSYDYLGAQRTEGGKLLVSTGVVEEALVNKAGQLP